MRNNLIFSILIASFSSFAQSKSMVRPNILLIMADDMGFSDLGSMGSKINTPTLDKLAANGFAYTNFYNTGRCCPSRASLLTGKYAHKVGLGWMTAANLKKSGYTGDLDTNSKTIAEVLSNSKYECYLSGKWHVTSNKYINDTASKHNWPLQRGFKKYFGILGGGDSYYIPNDLVHNNQIIPPPPNMYLTDAISDSAVAFLQQHKAERSKNPFFCYVAYTTPHRPLHAFKKDIEKYKGRFKDGWDELRAEKSKYLMASGWVNKGTAISKKDGNIPAWASVSKEEQLTWQARMEVYAAQMDVMDQGIGRIISFLKSTNQLDNTLIIFLSDNGGNEELEGGEMPMKPGDILKIGEETPRFSYHREWAQVSNTPFRSYKSNMYEGGIASPLILHWPDYVKTGTSKTNAVSHIIDIMPTILTAAGVQVKSTDGINILPAVNGKSLARKAVYFEHETACAIRQGDWKLVSPKSSIAPYTPKWELYNLKNDRGETTNLANKHPDLVKRLAADWEKWALKSNVYPLDGRGWFQKIAE
jgi:arylsulfatase